MTRITRNFSIIGCNIVSLVGVCLAEQHNFVGVVLTVIACIALLIIVWPSIKRRV